MQVATAFMFVPRVGAHVPKQPQWLDDCFAARGNLPETTMMANEQQPRCAHEGCDCAVKEGQTYCSAYCERAETERKASGEAGCGCGHPGCEGH